MAKSLILTLSELSVVRVALKDAIASEESFQRTCPDHVSQYDIDLLKDLRSALDKICKY